MLGRDKHFTKQKNVVEDCTSTLKKLYVFFEFHYELLSTIPTIESAAGPRISEHTDIKLLHQALCKKFVSEIGQCRFTAASGNLFPPFVDTKQFFAMKIANHHDRLLTPLESWDQDGFWPWALGHQIQIMRLELLQRRGNQITGEDFLPLQIALKLFLFKKEENCLDKILYSFIWKLLSQGMVLWIMKTY